MSVRYDASESHLATLNLGSQANLTVGCRAKVTSGRATFSTIWSFDQGMDGTMFGLQTDSDGLTLKVWDDGAGNFVTTGPTLVAGVWYDLWVTYAGASGLYMYKPVASNVWSFATWTSSAKTLTRMLLGDDRYVEWWNGPAQGFGFWLRGLTIHEIMTMTMGLAPRMTAGLQAFWPHVRANEAFDYSGRGLGLSGGTTTTTEDGPPVVQRVVPPRLWLTLPAGGGGSVTFDGVASAASGASGALSVTRAVAGGAPVATSGSGDTAVARSLSGSTPAATSGSGAPVVARSLSSTAAVASDASGSAAVARPLASTAQVASGASGAPAVARPLSGHADAAVSGSADLSIQGQTTFAGVAQIACSAAGTLSVARSIAGNASTATDGAGGLSLSRLMVGSAAVATFASAAAALSRALSSVAATASGGLGSLRAVRGLSGAVPVAASAQASLNLGVPVVETEITSAVRVDSAISSEVQGVQPGVTSDRPTVV